MAREMDNETKALIRKVEVKRSTEKITKKEFCNTYGLHYNFYMNCLNGSNVPSKKMIDTFKEYLMTSKDEVYRKLFESRDADEKFHPSLGLTKKDIKNIKNELEDMQSQEPSL
nr:MAG TPA: Regulatory protein-modification, helix-turn-helix, transcriptional regulator, DNA [Caudoviricetes sp.]